MAKGKKTGGRKKGSLNKVTKTFKELVVNTVQYLQQDKKFNLTSWAKSNPTEFYKIAAKLIPSELTGTLGIKKLGKDLQEEESYE